MNEARQIARLPPLAAMFAAGLLGACGPQRVRTPDSGGQTLVVLLPDAGTSTTGLAAVSNAAGRTDLTNARDSTQVSPGQPPSPVTTMSEADVERLFGDVIAALPPPAQRFTLLFRFESDELTEQSRSTVPDILQAVKSRSAAEVLVVGHTDTTGSSASNFALGLKRATMVRNLLLEAGLPASAIEITSFGEADLLIPTPDETREPRNRRVEVTVK